MKKRVICFSLSFIVLLFTVPFSAGAQADRKDPVKRFLIFGRDQAAALTDSIFLVSRNEMTEELRVLQIPRDTYAAYTEGSYRKLNGALRALGSEKCKAFFSRALGVKIDWFAAMNLECVSLLVDTVGGVDLDVPMNMDYSDPSQGLEIHLSKGRQHLDGASALSFIRFRSGYVNADLGRMDAQKMFLRAFAEKCQNLNAATFLRMFMISVPHMQTDLPVTEAIRISRGLLKCDFSSVPIETAPGEAIKGKSGAWYYVLNREGTRSAVNWLLSPIVPVSDEAFDPDRVFDRVADADFHRIYSSPAK